MAANGGIITATDLSKYQARVAEPLKLIYRGFPVLTTPPSSAGGTAVAVMLNTLEQFDLKLGMEGSAMARHLQIEAMRLGFGARTRLTQGNQPVEQLISKEYAQQAAKTISLDHATPMATTAAAPSGGESFDTTHFTIADPFGNIVTNTYTLNGFFGSQVIAKGTGVLLNNYINASQMRSLKPGERIPANMTPTIILRKEGTPWAAFGTPGAMTISSTLMQIVTNLIDFKMSLRDAVEFPRLHYAGSPNGVDAEPAALVFDVAEKLRKMGHRLNPNLRSQGDVNAVLIEEGTGWKQGWADGRRGGVVKGF
jgi:gamma-glutamyltranspeptidase/glutathione hydrolase